MVKVKQSKNIVTLGPIKSIKGMPPYFIKIGPIKGAKK